MTTGPEKGANAAHEINDAIAKALAKADHWEAKGNAVWAADWRRTAARLEALLASGAAVPARRKTAAEKEAVEAWKAEYVEALQAEAQAEFVERAFSYPPSQNVLHEQYANVLICSGGDRLIVTPGGSRYVMQQLDGELGWRSYRFFEGARQLVSWVVAVALDLDPDFARKVRGLPDDPKDALLA